MTTAIPDGCMCIRCFDGLPHLPVDEGEIERCLARAGHPKPQAVVLRVVTMPTRPDPHDPASCTLMVCSDQACITANARRRAQGSGRSDPFSRAA